MYALGSESWNLLIVLKTESIGGYHLEVHACSKERGKFEDVTRNGAEPTPHGQRETVCTDPACMIPDNQFLGEGIQGMEQL